MADVYFEIADCAIPKFDGKYFVSRDVDSAAFRGSRASYLEHSDRAWMEHEGNVWFIKNRYLPKPYVDRKEFMWIKLKAEVVNG